jgi:hypothetical protein
VERHDIGMLGKIGYNVDSQLKTEMPGNGF